MRDGPRRFGQDSSCPALLRYLTRSMPVTRTGLSPSTVAGSTTFRFLHGSLCQALQPRHVRKRTGLGSTPFARHYSGYRLFLSFPQGTKMFQFPWFAPSSQMVTGLQPAGLPHSDIRGSIPVCKSPRLFAAYHVLLRLRKPRHPPFALNSFPFLQHLFPDSCVGRRSSLGRLGLGKNLPQ